MTAPRAIVVDFDGTLCTFAFPGIGPVKHGAREALQKFKDLGYRVVISSCRTCRFYPEIFCPSDGKAGVEAKNHKEMVQWLADNKIPHDEVDDGTRGKPMADFYVDDKGVRFNENWDQIAEFVERMT